LEPISHAEQHVSCQSRHDNACPRHGSNGHTSDLIFSATMTLLPPQGKRRPRSVIATSAFKAPRNSALTVRGKANSLSPSSDIAALDLIETCEPRRVHATHFSAIAADGKSRLGMVQLAESRIEPSARSH
jgi:hypothetical protein